MIIYGLKTCDTCRKAVKAFPDATFRDVRSDGVPQAVIKAALAAFPGTLLNTRSTTWRALSEAERTRPAMTLITEHPTLMKRPLIAVDDRLFLGWNNGIQAEVEAVIQSVPPVA